MIIIKNMYIYLEINQWLIAAQFAAHFFLVVFSDWEQYDL